MKLDENYLPLQGTDKEDQLHRAGFYVLGDVLNCDFSATSAQMLCGIVNKLRGPQKGLWKRHADANWKTTSCDQLVPLICIFVMTNNRAELWAVFWQMVKRFGFAPNTVDTDPTKKKFPIGDPMIFRTLPLFLRGLFPKFMWTWADWLLITLAISSVEYTKKSPEHVDIHNTLATLLVCSVKREGFSSRFARNYFARYQGPTYESDVLGNRAYAALKWCNRAEEPARGNPEMAEMWKPLCEKFFQYRGL